MADIQDTNKATTPEMREQWNGFLDHLDKQGMAGNPSLDDPRVANAQMEMYRQINPDFSITADHIPTIQNEQQVLRNGGTFGSLAPEHLQAIQGGFNPGFANRPVNQTGQLDAATSQLYYPVSKEHGTEIEKYASTLGPVPVTPKPISPADSTISISGKTPELPIVAPKTSAPPPPDAIPLPDFTNAKSRGQYAENFKKKHNGIFQDVPSNIQYAIGDIPLNVNEAPRGATDTSKNIVTKYGKQYGIDPALLYTSYMAEGGSGLYKSKATGLDTKNRKPGEFGYQDYFGDKDFPINGGQSFGFTTFSDRFPELVKGGYLPKSFEKNFRGNKAAGEFSANNFRDADSAMQAKAAMLKFSQDEVEKYAKEKRIELSPQAKEFFTLAAFNGGEGGYLKRMLRYKNEGLLEGDKFLQGRPKSEEGVKGSTSDVWGHVAPRMRIRDALKKEHLFE